jgi:hypothetical protein
MTQRHDHAYGADVLDTMYPFSKAYVKEDIIDVAFLLFGKVNETTVRKATAYMLEKQTIPDIVHPIKDFEMNSERKSVSTPMTPSNSFFSDHSRPGRA